jgi:hypothetical protein
VDLGTIELPTSWLQTVSRVIAKDCDRLRLATIHALSVVAFTAR